MPDVTKNIVTSKPLILDAPQLQSFPQKLTTKSLTVFFWGVWLYMWSPLLTLLAWIFGMDIFYSRLVLDQGIQAFWNQLPWYTLTIDIMVGSLILWAITNWLRFRGLDRRRPRPTVSLKQLSEYYSISEPELARWSKCRRVVMHHDDLGHPISAEAEKECTC